MFVIRMALFFLLSSLFVSCQTTSNNVISTSDETLSLISFASDEGIKRFASSNAKIDFFTLANNFEAQSNALFCGPTTAAIVLNSLKATNENLPKDKSRLSKADYSNLPKGFDPTVARYTQENIFSKSQKPRSEVFGKPTTVKGKKIQDFGYQLRQFDTLLKSHGLRAILRVVDEKQNDDVIIAEISENLKRANDYVIVNYKRAEVGQQGGGHISPVGAYDEKTRSFLILDVNPAKAEWVWMPAKVLIKGMRSFDTVENRGYILVAN